MIARIGKYTIEKELGHGGFGDVFLAFDPDTGQKVAIKHLRVELGLDPEMLKRFQHEIRTTASLRHRNIVTIHASGVEDGNPYLVMEFLEGRTLKDIIQERQPLSLLEKVGIMTQVAEGLAYAHSKGIVHRDVKPENIMLLPDDSVKIMDFGIALAPDRHTVMTETGGIIGTPPYFAPEQLEGYKANEQTDIFSLGDVYYELLTGQHPFERFKHDWKALQMAILSFDPPAVSQMAAGCPEALELLVHRMIAKEREFRYGTFEELLLDSKAVLVDLQRERAGALLREVPPLVETGDLQTALGILREAQQLDPGNREARQLRDTITQKLQRSVVQGRVNELLSEAEGLVGERRFGEAVQSLESAARLDSSNVTVQVRLGEVKARLDRSVRASRLVSEARLKQQKGQLTDALERLTAALAIDPDHTEALALSPRMRELVERRERDSRREQALQKAGGHLGAKRYSEALAVLEQIEQEQPGAAEVAQLRERIEQAKEHERVRRAERFNLAVSRTREAMQAGELERAGQMLDHLLANFAEEPGAAGVLPALREQLNAQMRAQQIGACRAEARDLLQKKAYGEALGLLGEALRRFPGDTGLERLQRSAEELYRAQQHSEAIAAVMREAGEKRDAGDFRGALEVVSAARTRIGEEAGLVELARQLEMEIEQQRYAAGLEELLHASRQLIAGGKYSQAIEGITRAPEYGGEAEVRALLESARVSEAIAEERRVVAEALVAAEGLSTRGDWAAALGPVEQALGRYPHDPGLKQTAERLREQIARERRRGAIERHRATIRHEIEDGAWKRAEAALLRARAEFPNESAFEELAKQVEAGLFNAGLDEVATRVREKLAAGNIPEALENIEATRTVFAHDTRWKSLAEEVARRRAYEATLEEAERHRKEGDLSTAVNLLTRVIREGPADERAIQTIAAIQAERSEAAKRAETAEIAEMAARVREHLARDDIQQAAGELDKARAKHPEASYWATLKSEIDARQKLLVRQAEIAAAVESVRAHVKRDQIRQALSELIAARSRYPGQNEWATLGAEIDARQAALKRQAEIEAQQAAAKRQAELEAQQAAAKRQAELEAQQAAAKRQAELEAQQAAAKRQAELEAQQAAARRRAEIEAQQAAAKRQAELEAQQAAAKRQAELEAQQAAARR
ncbi:MAG: protein kinase, partial [Acidobacteriia bacterium]|nr:protein kinase [Terriglobia bacterium]